MNKAIVVNPPGGQGELATGFGGQPSMLGVIENVPLFSRYLRIALRWKWIIIASVLTCLLLGGIATVLMTRQFTASATIEIARESNKVVQIEGV